MSNRIDRINHLMTDAEHYTPHEMWQRRNNQQPVKRVASVAIGTLFQSEFIRTYVRTRLYVNKNFLSTHI